MAVVEELRTNQSAVPTSQAPPARRHESVMSTAVWVTGAGMAFIVGRDGVPVWQLARVAVIAALTVLVFWGTSRFGRVGRAATAFIAGLFAVPVGVGIAVPHLTKVGLELITVAGLLVLAGGIVLLITGAFGLISLARRWRWRVPMAAGLLIMVYVVAWPLGQAVAATNVPRVGLGSTTPADHGLPYRDVEFQTPDSVTLSGWYVPSTNRAAVVLLHGAGSTRASVLDHAVVLARHGYGVLLVDARGHGRSDGRAMDFGWHGDEDVAGAVSFLAAQAEVDPARIGAIGMSMGGEEAIGAAATDERIRAVVAEGATTRVPADKSWLSDEFGFRGSLQEGVDWLLYNTVDLLTEADQPIALRDAMRAAAPRPVLLIAAGDVADEGRASRYFQTGSPDTVQLWEVPETGHTHALETHPDEWESRVTDFLASALVPTSP